jgi:hypothetical protein
MKMGSHGALIAARSTSRLIILGFFRRLSAKKTFPLSEDEKGAYDKVIPREGPPEFPTLIPHFWRVFNHCLQMTAGILGNDAQRSLEKKTYII